VADEFSAPVLWLPEVAFVPLQAPDAVHDDARVLDQLNVLAPPGLTVLGLAPIVTVGRQLWANACGADIMLTASANNTHRTVGFMGGDIRRNLSNSVCLQTATWSERIPTWLSHHTC